MKAKLSLLRNLALLGALALSAPLLTPRPAQAEDFCLSDYIDGWACYGCRIGNCWAAACSDGVETISDGGCDRVPPPPQYA